MRLFYNKYKNLQPLAGNLSCWPNYYNKEIKDEYDNEPIGIILCTGKKRSNNGINRGNLFKYIKNECLVIEYILRKRELYENKNRFK